MIDPDNFETELLGSEEIAEQTRLFHFRRPEGFDYEPGQFVGLQLLDLPEGDEPDDLRMFSLASAPHDPALAIGMRMRDSAYKRHLRALAPGARLSVTPAMGDLTLPQADGAALVMLAGGIGITPFYGMLRHLQATGDNRPLTLVYANRHPGSAAWRRELEALAASMPGFRLVEVYGENVPESVPVPGVTLAPGQITAELLKGVIATPLLSRYYVVGPDPMVEAMDALLAGMGVAPESVVAEGFTGY